METILFQSSLIRIYSSSGVSADVFVRLKKFFYNFVSRVFTQIFFRKVGDNMNIGKEFRIWWHYIGSNKTSISFIGSKVFETVDQVREEFLNMIDDADKVVISKIEIVG